MERQEMIACNKPELAEQTGMVYQVWEDGEITLQKSGSLLWQRSLHCIKYGTPDKKVELLYPDKHGHSYLFVTEQDANRISAAIFNS
jgi:hypothetical protein